MEDAPRFIVGHHDPKRSVPVTAETIQNIHAANYDMVTSPITTPHFHSRVLTLLSSSLSSYSDEDITQTKNASPITIPPLNLDDTPLTPEDYINQVIGVTSSWIDLGSPDPVIADVSRQVLQIELMYAAFCGITYALISGPRLRGQGVSSSGIAQYARALLDALAHGPYMQLHIWFPMVDHSEDHTEQMGDLASFVRQQYLEEDEDEEKRLDIFGAWEAWDMIRSICKYPSRLCVALSIPKLLPPVPIQSRWYSEPVRLITLDADVFTKNAKGYPVLGRSHQMFIFKIVRLRTTPWFLLCNVAPMASNNTNGLLNPATNKSSFPTLAQTAGGPAVKDPHPHLSYIRNLQTKQPFPDAIDRFGAGYQDYLQAPLQPLSVNLESITYEVFEKDPIKYAWYERAVARALHDWIEQGKPTSNPDGRVVVAVVGAGRGPLVTRALKASEDVGVEIDMWALEKNPNAFVLLQRHNENTWNTRVNLVKSDMRTWRGPIRVPTKSTPGQVYNKLDDGHGIDDDGAATMPADVHPSFTGSPTLDSTYLLATATETTTPTPYKIDILISELLGSFGDNELSPECLDGVQHLLNPVHGISIPASYTTHVTPIAAPKLHADIMHGMASSNPSAYETPYVVMLNAIDYLSTNPGPENGEVSSPQPPPRQVKSPTSPKAATPYSKAHTRTSQAPSQAQPQQPLAPARVPVIQQTWAFQHPNPALPSILPSTIGPSITTEPSLSNAHNTRVCTLTFPIPNRGTCHGLAGYFETVLYRGVELSTNPNTMDQKSEAMISWFPIYFPLKAPLFLPDNSELQLTMWRKTDDRKVWYEWLVDVYAFLAPPPGTITRLDDAKTRTMGGPDVGRGKTGVSAFVVGTVPEGPAWKDRKIRVGGSDLHSSIKEACLM